MTDSNLNLIKDPRICLDNVANPEYNVLKGGLVYNPYVYTSSSVNNTSIQFSSVNPSSSNVIVSRTVWLSVPVRLIITKKEAGDGQILEPGKDAPRFMPISNSISNASVTINGMNNSVDLGYVLQPMMHYNTFKLKEQYLTGTPIMMDQAQTYAQLAASVRNPLALYFDSIAGTQQARGAFDFTIVSNSATTAIIDFVCVEPLLISPFKLSSRDEPGFYNISTMNVNLNFFNDCGQKCMWSHSDASRANASCLASNLKVTHMFTGFDPATPFSYADSTPFLTFDYITPSQLQVIPPVLSYSDYFNITRYETLSAKSYTPNEQATEVINTLQLSSVPSYILIFARQNFADKNIGSTDSYFSIENISVQISNTPGLLAGTPKYKLYEISVGNGYELSYQDWGASKMHGVNSGDWSIIPEAFNTYTSGVGSVLKLEFGTDLCLQNESLAPGSTSQLMLQYKVTIRNASTINIRPSIETIVVNEGIFSITSSNSAAFYTSYLTQDMVINALTNGDEVDYNEIRDVEGGSFGSTVKSGFKKALPYIKKYGKEYGPTVAKAALEVGKTLIGLGGNQAGVMAGGKSMSRSELRNRLAKY